MPEPFVEAAAALNVDASLWSQRDHSSTMAASSPARDAGPRTAAVPLLPGGQRAWMLVFAGWTIVGLTSFWCSIILPSGSPAPSWSRLLVFSLATAWVWAALTPVTLLVLRHTIAAPVQLAQSVIVYAGVGVGFVAASGLLHQGLAVLTGVDSASWTRAALVERIDDHLLAYLAIVSLGWSSHLYRLYRTRQLHASELEARLAKTHLQVLKMQLQPHFLFNTLNAIAELVHTEPEAADQMITRLGRLLRLSLDHAGHQVVPLRQEIEFLRVYVEIEQVRFQDRLQIVWDISPDTLDAAVPTLLWQPVLENAIRHGVTPLAAGGRITISSRLVGDELVLEISDNGLGLPTGGPTREGVGLRNVRERMEQLYGVRAGFALTPAGGGGTIATLRLPYAHCESAHTPVPLGQTVLQEFIG
jgi:two-component system LytT family sensor kinase